MPAIPPVDYANPRAVGELAEPLRSRVAQMIHDAPRHGLVLVSGRRSPYQQWILRHQRCPGLEFDMRRCRGNPVTAVPYASNHQKGTAADLGGSALSWAIANRGRYGLGLPIKSENWHFEVSGTPTVKITPYGRPTAKPDPNKGRKWKGFRAGATNESVYAAGGLNNEVIELQIRLQALSKRRKAPKLNPGALDGVYGPTSQRAVRAFKHDIIAMQKASRQPVWANADTNVGEKTINMLRFWTP